MSLSLMHIINVVNENKGKDFSAFIENKKIDFKNSFNPIYYVFSIIFSIFCFDFLNIASVMRSGDFLQPNFFIWILITFFCLKETPNLYRGYKLYIYNKTLGKALPKLHVVYLDLFFINYINTSYESGFALFLNNLSNLTEDSIIQLYNHKQASLNAHNYTK